MKRLRLAMLGVVALADEVGVQGMDGEARVDGEPGGAQALGDDLAAVEPAPRVSGPDADERVGAVLLQRHHRRELHGRIMACSCRTS